MVLNVFSEFNYLINMITQTQNQQLTRKQALQFKRQKAKLKHVCIQSKQISKQEGRKERNRCAAQRSRDKKKSHLQSVQKENIVLRSIMERCQRCRQQCLMHVMKHSEQQEEHFHQEYQALQQPNPILGDPQDSQIIPIVHSPDTFLSNHLIRFQDQSSSQNVSKYFWFCCLVVLCLVNIHQNPSTTQPGAVISPLLLKPVVFTRMTQQVPQVALMKKQQIQNTCTKCLDCFKNMTQADSKGLLSIVNKTINQTMNASKVLFCRGKTKFFQKIYSALKGQVKIQKQVAWMLVKGANLLEFMQQNCFADTGIDPNEQYMISFTMAILEVIPFKHQKHRTLTVQP